MAFSLNSSANHQNQITRKKIVSSPLSSIVNDAFQAKCAKELNKLRSNCRKTLQQDLTRLFDKEIFADTFIEGDTFRKPCHSCILASRAPHFYSLLVNYFDSTSSKHSKRGFNSYRLPSDIDCKEITDFLQKVYCHEDICLDTPLIIDKLSFHISKMSSESGIDKKSVLSSCEDNLINELIKEDSLEDFKQVGNDGFDKDSLKPADSLELVTDSLNNISLSSEDNKNDRQSTDYEDSLAIGQKDGGLTSSESSQMVRSGTFDMLASIPLEDQVSKAYQDNGEEDMENDDKGNNFDQDKGSNRISTGIENGQDDRPLSVINLRHQIDSLELDLDVTKEESTKDSLDDENEDITTDGDAATPIAEAPESLTTRSQSSSLFQFFVDIDSMSSSMPNCKPQEKSENSMTSSGFMFIDLNSVTTEEQEKSRTIERDKNKSKDKRVPQIGPQEDRVAIKSGSSLFMKTKEVESRASSSCGINTNGKTGGTKQQQISNNVSSSKSVNYRKKSGSSFVLRGSSSDRRSSSKSRAHHTNRRTTSPMSSMDSGMLSSLNSECAHGDDEDWLLSVKPHSRSQNKAASLWTDEALEDTSIDVNSKHPKPSQKLTSEKKNNNNNSTNNPGLRDKAEDVGLRRTLNSCSKLGEDLLQMYYSGNNADITIRADNRTIKAHKCILVARSPYFSAMFSGEWRDSKTSSITLQGFSYTSVHFALCHIYSGALNIPDDDSINLAELALLSNLLALDTLRDVVVYELEKTYCHFFHKPCSECTVGVVDCLIVSSECGFSALHQKCLTWSGKHFVRLWPTRSFACLPSSLLDSCFQSTIHSMTPKSIIEIMLNCDRLTKTTPKVKWAEPIFSLIGRLIEQCVNFVAGNYDLIVASDAFISLGRANSWNISAVEETFLAAMNNLTPEIACKTLIKLSSIISISENEEAFGYGPYAESYVALVRKMYRHCERFLVHNVNQAVTVTSWSLLPVDIQQRIKDSAIIVFEFDKPLAPRPQLSSSQLQSLRKKRSSENSEPTSKATSSTSSRAASRSRLKSNENRNQMYLARSSSDHIYDEVSFEQDELTSGATSLPVNPMSDHRDYRSQGKSSKMSSSFNRRSTEINDDDFDDALFSNNGRQIDQEMSRQTVKQDISRRKSPQSTPVRSSTNLRPSSRSRTGSSSLVSRSLASRPPFK